MLASGLFSVYHIGIPVNKRVRMRNSKNSMLPESALISVGTRAFPQESPRCVVGGGMRNSNRRKIMNTIGQTIKQLRRARG